MSTHTTSPAYPVAVPQLAGLFSPASGIAVLPQLGVVADDDHVLDGTDAGEDPDATVVLDDPVPPLPAGPLVVDAGVALPGVAGADSVEQAPARHGVRGPRGTGQWQLDRTAHDELAVRARQGDAAALQALLELIDADGSIRLPIRRVVMDATAVEDISQEVLIKVAERLGTWDGRSRFTTWLFAVARNAAIDHLRRTAPAAEQLPADLGSDQQRLSSLIATRRVVQDLLADLPDAYRRPVWLRDVEQLEYDEIAHVLDLNPATVRTRVSRGRAMIAAAWAASRT